MFLNISYYFAISLILILFLVVIIYIWRKINDSELYAKVLERKLTNLKKENNDLRSLIDKYSSDNVSMDIAETIMNDVFGEKSNKCTNDLCQINDESVPNEIIEIIDNETEENNDNQETLIEENGSILSESIDKYSKSSLQKMNIDKLKDICNSLKLSNTGTKNILIDRIYTSQ